jgi:hypothetical protein
MAAEGTAHPKNHPGTRARESRLIAAYFSTLVIRTGVGASEQHSSLSDQM